ncbi:hypothetical protein Trydic_g21571 [Trypoxylus dichotomus]
MSLIKFVKQRLYNQVLFVAPESMAGKISQHPYPSVSVSSLFVREGYPASPTFPHTGSEIAYSRFCAEQRPLAFVLFTVELIFSGLELSVEAAESFPKMCAYRIFRDRLVSK